MLSQRLMIIPRRFHTKDHPLKSMLYFHRLRLGQKMTASTKPIPT